MSSFGLERSKHRAHADAGEQVRTEVIRFAALCSGLHVPADSPVMVAHSVNYLAQIVRGRMLVQQ